MNLDKSLLIKFTDTTLNQTKIWGCPSKCLVCPCSARVR